MSLIEIKHLRKEYPNVIPLKDVNATVDRGEVVSIIGPSGTGKSTLLRCLNRLETPTSGQILVDGVDMCDPNTDLATMRRKMGMVFQNYNLFGHKLVAENVMMAPMDLLGLSTQEAWEKAIKLLDMVGLKDKALSWPHELSGGQRQRVAIARGLAMDPQILLFDEPTSALDPTMVSEVLSVMTDLAERGLTMMVVTHEMRFARDASTRVFYMDRGEVWESGPPQQIFEHPQRIETHDFIFRVRCWHYDIMSTSFDLPAMMASLEQYCLRQFMGLRAHNMCELIVEEIMVNSLLDVARKRGMSEPNLHCNLYSGEGGVDMTFEVDYRAMLTGGDPLTDGETDSLTQLLINRLTTQVDSIEPGVKRFVIKQD